MKVLASEVCNRIGVTSFDDTVLVKALRRVPAISESGPWIAGGAVRKTLQGETLDSDWDFFFASQEQADDFEDGLTNMGAKLLSKNDKNSTYILPATIPEGSEGEGLMLPEMKVQAIKFRFYASAEEVIDSFDFTISQFAFDGTHLYMAPFALWDLARKRLVPHKLTYAAASMRRMIKYARQGFTVCNGAIAEMLEQVVADPNIIHEDVKYID